MFLYIISAIFIYVVCLVMAIVPLVVLYCVYTKFRSLERIQYYMMKDDYTDAFNDYEADMKAFKKRTVFLVSGIIVLFVLFVIVCGVLSFASGAETWNWGYNILQGGKETIDDLNGANWNNVCY